MERWRGGQVGRWINREVKRLIGGEVEKVKRWRGG